MSSRSPSGSTRRSSRSGSRLSAQACHHGLSSGHRRAPSGPCVERQHDDRRRGRLGEAQRRCSAAARAPPPDRSARSAGRGSGCSRAPRRRSRSSARSGRCRGRRPPAASRGPRPAPAGAAAARGPPAGPAAAPPGAPRPRSSAVASTSMSLTWKTAGSLCAGRATAARAGRAGRARGHNRDANGSIAKPSGSPKVAAHHPLASSANLAKPAAMTQETLETLDANRYRAAGVDIDAGARAGQGDRAAGPLDRAPRRRRRARRLRRPVRPARGGLRAAAAGRRDRRRRHQAAAAGAERPPRHRRLRPGRDVRQRPAGAGRGAAVLPRLLRHRQARPGGGARGRSPASPRAAARPAAR